MGCGAPGPFAPISQILYLAVGVLGLIAVAFVIRGADERTAAPAPVQTT